ncbi:hypothetical protein EPN90_04750 [Patescibacteria group bacterium]|nr:MAG: hypothetical protein EPN90_04750 [Patescibacteria group bacterium]
MQALGRRIFSIRGRIGRRGLVIFVFLLLAGALLAFHPVFAQAEANQASSGIGNFLATLLVGIIGWLGKLLLLLTDVFLIPIAQYNGFITSKPVELGWVIVRDLTNMFFVLMMLIIAIGTILGLEEFSYRKLLPRLLIIAVVINFSKVIVGLMIDFSQVLMLTFVNGFAAAAGGNVIQLFQVVEAMKLSDKLPPNVALGIWDFVGGALLALIMLIIAIAVIAIMAMMLAFRIVLLWLLVILSPIAFFLSTFPKGKASQAYAMWWGKLGDNLVAGPLLAFFLWLSFSVTQSGGLGNEVVQGGSDVELAGTARQYMVTELGGTSAMTGFIVGLAMLLAGMYVTAEVGAMGGGMLRGTADWFKGKAQGAAKFMALAPFRAGWAATKAGAGWAEKSIYGATGIGLAPQRYITALKDWRKRVGERKELAGKDIARRRMRAGGRLAPLAALAGSPDDFFETYMSLKGAKLAARQAVFGSEGRQLVRGRAARDEAADLRRRAAEARTGADSSSAAAAARSLNLLQDKGSSIVIRERLSQLIAASQRKAADYRRTGAGYLAAGDEDRAVHLGDLAAGEDAKIQEMRAWLDQDRDRGEEEYEVEVGVKFKNADLQEEIRGSLKANVGELEVEAEAQRAQSRSLEDDAAKEDRRAETYGERAGTLGVRARFAEAALRKRVSEEKKNLPEDMTPTDRLDYTQGAVRDGNWERFRIMLSKIADEEEFSDLLQDDKIWGRKFGTNTAGLQQFAQELQRRFGLDQEESLRELSGVFGTLVGKGQTSYFGRLGQDRGTGRLRWNDEPAAARLQAGKLDKRNPKDVVGKDAVESIFEISAAGDYNLTDAGLAMISASERLIMEKLKKGEIKPKMLAALQQSATRIAAHVSTDFMQALQSAKPKVGSAKSQIDAILAKKT